MSGVPGSDTDLGLIPDADWIAAGFRWSTSARLKPGQVGLWQARIRDARGTAYFVTVFIWDWREFRGRGCAYDWSYMQDDQFRRGDQIFNVQQTVRCPAEALEFTAEIWTKLGCDHYELDDYSTTPAHPASEDGR